MTKRALCVAVFLLLASRAFAQATVAITPPPTTTASAGSTLSYTTTFWNSSSGFYGGGTQYFSLIPAAGGGTAVTLGSWIVPGLAPGATSTVTTSVTIPANTLAGNYLIGAGNQGCTAACVKSPVAIAITAGGTTYPLSVQLNVSGPGLGYIAITNASTGASIGNCPPPANCSPAIPAGTSVKLAYVAVTGGMFQGWVAGSNTGCAAGTAACTFTMNAAKSISGNIAPGSMPNVSVSVYVSGHGTVTGGLYGQTAAFTNCNQPFGGCVTSGPSGSQFTLTANPGMIPASGSTPQHAGAFIKWTGGTGCAGTSATLIVTASAALSCTANFQ